MNTRQTLHNAGRLGGFLARHFMALLVTVALALVLWTVTYFALLLWAGFAGGGIGSPASYPFGLLFGVVAGTLVSTTLFLPSTAFAEWIACRCGLPILAQIPITVAFFALLCLIIAAVASIIGSALSLQSISISFSVLLLVHLIPLGLYWWVAQSVPLLVSLGNAFGRW